MSFAVLSDIHSNHIALKRCIEYSLSRDVQEFILLGDYASDLPHPEKTMRILYELASQYPCRFIRGNREDYFLDYRKNGEKGWKKGQSTTGTLLYTYQHLTKEDLQFFADIPIAETVQIGGMQPFTICHGSPFSTTKKLLPNDEETLQILKNSSTQMIVCGHTHIQGTTKADGKRIVNAGAIGMPMYSEGKTQFMLLHPDGQDWKEEYISLPYDVEQAISEMEEDGFGEYAPYWCLLTKESLRHGDMSPGGTLRRAMDLCREEKGECIWPDIPEEYLARAAEEITRIGRN